MTAKAIDLDGPLARRMAENPGQEGDERACLPLVAVLDNIRSLWNVGSIFRTADACGVRRLFLAGITGTPPRKEISKTALGAEESVAWRYVSSASEAVDAATHEGYTPVVLESSRDAVAIDEIQWPEKVCLILGNEVAGVAPGMLATQMQQVYIPMAGKKESFNVAVAFGIAAFEAASQLRRRNPEVQFRR